MTDQSNEKVIVSKDTRTYADGIEAAAKVADSKAGLRIAAAIRALCDKRRVR